MPRFKKSYPLLGYLALNPDEDLEDSAVTAYIPLANVSGSWDGIILKGADADETSARVTFQGCFQPQCPNHETESQFIAAVKVRVSHGSVVQVSLERRGDDPYKIDTDEKATTFVSTIMAIVDKYGFNGVDIYLTDVACGANGDDQDFRTVRDPSSVNLIWAVQTLRGTYDPSFVLSLTANVHSSGAGLDGQRSCLAVIHALRNIVDVFYLVPTTGNGHSTYTDVDGSSYEYRTPEYLMASANLLLANNGTPVQNSSELFPPLRAEQVFVLAELTHNLHDQYLHVNVSSTHDALACIILGENCTSDAFNDWRLGDGFRGFIADTVNDDERDEGAFRNGMAPLLHDLNSFLVDKIHPSEHFRARDLAPQIAVPIAVLFLVFCLIFWLHQRDRRRARKPRDLGIRPTSDTSTSPVSIFPSAQVPNDTLGGHSDAAVVSVSSPTETGGTILGADPRVEDLQSDAVPPERIPLLQDEVPCTDFSVDASETSLHRVVPEADGDVAEHPPDNAH